LLNSNEKINESGVLLLPILPAVSVAAIVVPEVQQIALGVIDERVIFCANVCLTIPKKQSKTSK
jgi:hypothetical protein